MSRPKSRMARQARKEQSEHEVNLVDLPDGWPDGAQVRDLVGPEWVLAAVRRAVVGVDRDALATQIEKFQPEHRRHVLRHAKVPYAAKVRRSMVDRLLA